MNLKKGNPAKLRKIILILSVCCISLVLTLIVREAQTNAALRKMSEVMKTQGVVQNEDGIYSDARIFLPKDIYVASGITIELYNSQVSSLGEQIANYHTKWTCEVGQNMERKFSITGTDELIGEYPLTFTIYSDMGIPLVEASTTLRIVPARQERFSLLTIGDSLSSDWTTYERLIELTDDKIIFMGTRAAQGALTEARMGFSAWDYLTAVGYDMSEPTETLQPFYSGKTKGFDWGYYKRKTGFSPDAVQLFLGTNGLGMETSENGDGIVQIVKNIHENDPDLPIYLVHTLYLSNQNGMGTWLKQSSDLFGGSDKYEVDQKVFNLMIYLEETLKDEKNLYFVPAGMCHDSANNFDTKEIPVNPHSSETEEVPADALHPSEAGFQQIADCLYSVICGTMDEWKDS